MKLRWKILVGVALAFGLVVLVSIIHHYQLRFAVEKYISELKAKDEPMDLAQVLPLPIPADQNSADILRHAATLLENDQTFLETNIPETMKMVARGKAMVCSQLPDVRSSEGTNSWAEAVAAVRQNDEAFKLLDMAAEHPTFDFKIHYERGFGDAFDFTNLNLVECRKSARYLVAAAMCNLHDGNTGGTVRNECTIISLANALQNERFVISELVSMAIAQTAIGLNWEILQSPGLTDEQLEMLQNNWAKTDYTDKVRMALCMERVAGEITLAGWRSSSSTLHHYLDLGEKVRKSMGYPDDEETTWTRIKFTAKIFLWRYWWSYADELRELKGEQALVDAIKSSEIGGSFQVPMANQDDELGKLGIIQMDSEFVMLLSGKYDLHSMLSKSVVDLSGTLKKVMRVEAAKQIIVTAIALKRYQLNHGEYPPNLKSLVPSFLPSMPVDPMDGQPLRYRLKADGTFVLYSVGENGKDDGGDPSLSPGVSESNFQWQNLHALDWVWPQPATDEEIKYYYAHPPK